MTLWKDNIIRDIRALNFSNEDEMEILEKVAKRHPMAIPQYYLNLINEKDPNDPIKKLSYPNTFENELIGDYDTSGEATNTKLPGLQHKYKTTALVLTTNACFMYCRHCFRKRMVGYSSDEINNRTEETIRYLMEHKEINNVLLSGGDSFCLSNEQIESYLEPLSKIEHLDFIRFGTRSPVVYPKRIVENKELLDILNEYNKKKRIMIVTQFNHPRELTNEAKEAINRLKAIGLSINNQTVILKGVNDNPKVMAELLNGLNSVGVDPYYIFQCRPVKAVKTGFQLTLKESFELVSNTRKELNGLSKRFKLIMSHPIGKIEIVGLDKNQMIFRIHQAKDLSDHDKIFIREIDDKACWLDKDLIPIR